MTFSACNKGAAAASEEPVEAFENAVTTKMRSMDSVCNSLPTSHLKTTMSSWKRTVAENSISEKAVWWICNAPTNLRQYLPQRKL